MSEIEPHAVDEPAVDQSQFGLPTYREVRARMQWRTRLILLGLLALLIGGAYGADVYHHRPRPLAMPTSVGAYRQVAPTPALALLERAATSRHVRNTGAAAYVDGHGDKLAVLAVATNSSSTTLMWRDLDYGVRTLEPLTGMQRAPVSGVHLYCGTGEHDSSVCSWYDPHTSAFVITNVAAARAAGLADTVRTAVDGHSG